MDFTAINYITQAYLCSLPVVVGVAMLTLMARDWWKRKFK